MAMCCGSDAGVVPEGSRLTECRNSFLLPSLEYGVKSGFDPRTDGGGHFARQRQGNLLGAAKADVAPFAIFLHPADPGTCAGWTDQQIESIVITIATGQLRRFDCRGAQPTPLFAPTSVPTLDAHYHTKATNGLQNEIG
jgi:hypothetical protein